MFGKIFAGMYEGSMMGAGMKVFSLWPYVLANCDIDGFLEVNPKLVAVKIGMTEKDAEEAISFLCSPDPRSRSKEMKGARMEKCGEYLYRVVNYEHYRKLRDMETRRKSNLEAVHRYRAKKKGQAVTPGTPLPGETAAVKGQESGALDENFEPVKPAPDVVITRPFQS